MAVFHIYFRPLSAPNLDRCDVVWFVAFRRNRHQSRVLVYPKDTPPSFVGAMVLRTKLHRSEPHAIQAVQIFYPEEFKESREYYHRDIQRGWTPPAADDLSHLLKYDGLKRLLTQHGCEGRLEGHYTISAGFF
jgi:hypothetical protein